MSDTKAGDVDLDVGCDVFEQESARERGVLLELKRGHPLNPSSAKWVDAIYQRASQTHLSSRVRNAEGMDVEV
jgi:hypothetical protein